MQRALSLVRSIHSMNATTHSVDLIRKMDEPDTQEIIAPSAGTHIVLPHYFRFQYSTSCIAHSYLALHTWD